MGMRWGEINPVILKLVSDLLRSPRDPDWGASWSERKDDQMFISPISDLAISLKVTTVVAPQRDEVRYDILTRIVDGQVDPDDLFEIIVGLRRFTLRVEAQSPKTTDIHQAIQALERLRTRLQYQTSRWALLRVNVDLTDILEIRDATATMPDKRRWGIAYLDIVMTAAFDDIDPVPIGWIERIIWKSEIQNEASETLPYPPNWGYEFTPAVSLSKEMDDSFAIADGVTIG